YHHQRIYLSMPDPETNEKSKTKALSRSGWWVPWWGQAGAPTAHAGIATQGQPCQNSPICSEVLVDKALGRRNEPWRHSCPSVQPVLNCPGSLISFSENTGEQFKLQLCKNNFLTEIFF
uniref:Uncharacterized protein n=1 Tax=Corvus moneduloides TaxID=1196302 RepID=A0A8C3ECT2_CORMO